MNNFAGKVAVITGAGSGFGREFARLGTKLGMRLVLADVQQDALDETFAEVSAAGAQAIARRVDVAKGEEIDALARATLDAYGGVHLVFNNAGVGGSGGLLWENTERDWQWLLGVNLWGVIHGVRVFTPLMLEAARRDPDYRGHIVNTASMAGMLNPPMMGPYNVSKHAVVSLTESLYQDLSLVTQQVACSVLCPYFVPTGIAKAHRNRPSELANDTPPTLSQRVSRVMSEKAVSSGKVSAREVADMVFNAIREEQFYIFSHPHALAAVKTRAEDIVMPRNPTDPFAERPEVRAQIIEALKG
ncbi:SDR family oxidoreductase [Paraburkholderia fungorum]|uniref:NAD(P)-dependent dehydrogenase (Short-subunit alcohol dehydrogenase family) n=1 Tax=Paraburkholderia fungorum TaxID=134537 RepID=A0AAW3VB35_9BURK|nr:SDR family oxidoreductase [Paraburkholderia fungorum]MBB4519153.1 NAD(P)-dependent dehydrogenase (short-subunit alcohol dehydrogenase family) [Paraburkholderia fungorum]MBB6207180.1 NAD(P)-dependent dehydrogenase (short-subunit alcohol dehydrogenase family) [Paraburkholderia fungorum]